MEVNFTHGAKYICDFLKPLQNLNGHFLCVAFDNSYVLTLQFYDDLCEFFPIFKIYTY